MVDLKTSQSVLTVEFGVLTLLTKSGLVLESMVLGKKLTEASRILPLVLTVEFGV